MLFLVLLTQGYPSCQKAKVSGQGAEVSRGIFLVSAVMVFFIQLGSSGRDCHGLSQHQCPHAEKHGALSAFSGVTFSMLSATPFEFTLSHFFYSHNCLSVSFAISLSSPFISAPCSCSSTLRTRSHLLPLCALSSLSPSNKCPTLVGICEDFTRSVNPETGGTGDFLQSTFSVLYFMFSMQVFGHISSVAARWLQNGEASRRELFEKKLIFLH